LSILAVAATAAMATAAFIVGKDDHNAYTFCDT
jgi:hypothetical protein